jgi:predicted RND superfamily exporter protein
LSSTSSNADPAPSAPLPPAPAAGWALFIVTHRRWALTFVLGLTAVLGFFALRLEFNFSPDALFVSDDPALTRYIEDLVPAFGEGSNQCIVALKGNLKEEGSQKALAALHHALAEVNGVESVSSLLTTQLPNASTGALAFDMIFDEKGRASPERVVQAAGDPLLQGLLLSKDASVTALFIQLEKDNYDQQLRNARSKKVQDAVEAIGRQFPDVELLLAGVPISQRIIIATLKRDQMTYVPLVVLLMSLLLFLSFRDWRGVLLPFLTTGFSTVWLLGYLVLRDHPINIVNNAIVILLLVIAIADAVHLVARFEDELFAARIFADQNGGEVDPDQVVARTIQAMTLPCFLTTTTTAVGFASTAVAEVNLIRQFGLDAAVGVMGAFVATILFVPAALRMVPLPKRRNTVHASQAEIAMRRRPIDGLLAGAVRISMGRPWPIVGVSALALVGAAFVVRNVESNQRLISELPPSDPSVQAKEFLEEKLSGIMPFSLVFQGPPQRLLRPDVLRAQAELAQWMRAHPVQPTIRAYPDVLAALDRALVGADQATPVATWSDAKVAQTLLLLEMGDAETQDRAREGLISDDGRLSRLQGLGRDVGSKRNGAFRKEVEARIAGLKLDGVEVYLTGGEVIAAQALNHIIEDMASSLFLAVILIFAFTLLLFRSIKLAAIALFPNVLPILFTLAAMELLGLPLRVATVVIFSMSLGVAVDACIHLLARLREETRLHSPSGDTVDLKGALDRTLRGSGRPVVYTTLLLLIGFSVMGLSEFRALRDFSILAGTTLASALIIDLLLLPALVLVSRPRFGRK